ncbi:hypothetical protein TI39_contig5841g00024 [Zymoseptoria brevis]|uniref:Uncharacterized protein n=1 Tax=Zymoseptoria brevis TaxID=1047168 RepID=A0A0F4G6B2_9PEZI|nr:hypothetical protein TI39_contig5841g00024 [Zymoseptoria brevis]
MGAELSKTSLSEEEERACRQKGRDIVLNNLYGPSRKRAPARKDSVATMTGEEVNGATLALVKSHSGVGSFEGSAQNPAVCEESEDDKDEEDRTAVVPTDQDKDDSSNTIRPDDEEPNGRHYPDYQSSALKTPQVLMGAEYNGGEEEAGAVPAEESVGGHTTQSQMSAAAQDPKGIDKNDEIETVVIAAGQETLDATNSMRNDSEEREEATPMKGSRKPVYRPRQGPFVRSEVAWTGLSRQMQQRWSSTNRIHKFGRARAPTCQRCRRDDAKGRQMESPCKVWLAGRLGKCQWCTLDGRPCVD